VTQEGTSIPDPTEGKTNLGKMAVLRKTGAEPFRDGDDALGFDVQSFWRWSSSDLMSNVTRGVLAEYIVARATDPSPDGVRDEWAAHDLTTPDGVKIEVKSAAFIQSWYQQRLSTITFRVPKTLAWDADTNLQAMVPQRRADVYVFALLAHQDQATINPLDISQWQFFVLPTAVLDQRKRSQHSITLPSLRKLAEPVAYRELADAVNGAARKRGELSTPPDETTDSGLSLTDIPDSDASWNVISEFALTFNGYDIEGCAEIANAHRHDSLTDLRTCLFYEQRRWRHFGETPDDEAMAYIRDLVKKLRSRFTSDHVD